MDPRSGGKHHGLDPETLIAYRENRLDAATQRRVEEQLRRSGRAQAELALVDEALVIGEEEEIPDGVSRRMRENLRSGMRGGRSAGGTPRSSSRWSGRRSLAAVAALAAVVALTIGVHETFVRDGGREPVSNLRGRASPTLEVHVDVRDAESGWLVRWTEIEAANSYEIEVITLDGRIVTKAEVAEPPWLFLGETSSPGPSTTWLVRVTARDETGVVASGGPAVIAQGDGSP